jgi:DNA-binding response OmpR family regulator
MLPDPTVLIVEDEQDVAQTMRRFIERSNMTVRWARTGAEAMELKESFRPDVVLVDLGLPDMNGVNLVTWLANKRDCGIIVVSGSGEEIDRVVGIELGADDYVTKPVAMRELVARIRAVHRRAARGTPAAPAAAPPPPQDTSRIALGSMHVDLKRRTVTNTAANGADAQVHLTAAEFVALEALIDAAPNAVPRETLCTRALRRPFHAEDRGVDQLILNLRKKLFGDDSAQRIIVSVRGAGYAISMDRDVLVAKTDNS